MASYFANCLRGWEGGGGTLIFSYIGADNFLGFKILKFFFFWGGGGSEKLIFFGYEDFVDIFGGSSHN